MLFLEQRCVRRVLQELRYLPVYVLGRWCVGVFRWPGSSIVIARRTLRHDIACPGKSLLLSACIFPCRVFRLRDA